MKNYFKPNYSTAKQTLKKSINKIVWLIKALPIEKNIEKSTSLFGYNLLYAKDCIESEEHHKKML